MVYSTDRSKAVVPMLVLLFVALWFILRGDLFLCLTLCYFVLVFFSPFSIAITSLGEERANLSAFRTFVRFVLVWICRFPLPLGVWEGLWFVMVALTGLFSYLFSKAGSKNLTRQDSRPWSLAPTLSWKSIFPRGGEALLLSTYNISFHGEIRKNIFSDSRLI